MFSKNVIVSTKIINKISIPNIIVNFLFIFSFIFAKIKNNKAKIKTAIKLLSIGFILNNFEVLILLYCSNYRCF